MGKQLVIKDANFMANAIYKSRLGVTSDCAATTPSSHANLPNYLWYVYGQILGAVAGKKIVGIQMYRSSVADLSAVTSIEIYKLVTSIDLTSFGSTDAQPITSLDEVTSLEKVVHLSNYDQQIYGDYPNLTPIQIMFDSPIQVSANTSIAVVLSNTVAFGNFRDMGYTTSRFNNVNGVWTPDNYQRMTALFDFIYEEN